MAKRLLVVEDDQDIAELLRMNMTDLGFEVEVVHNGDEGYEKGLKESWDFIILDLMLPGMDGVDICKKLRQENVDAPIMMLTAKAAELDRVVGLESGADDYMTKPFSITELQARVKARLRRRDGVYSSDSGSAAGGAGKVIRAGRLMIDPDKRKVVLGDKELHLTAKEFDLLYHFASQPGRVFKRDQLLDSVWGYGFEGYEHTVNSHINRLRSKVEEDAANPKYILTVWGVGYKFAESEELAAAGEA